MAQLVAATSVSSQRVNAVCSGKLDVAGGEAVLDEGVAGGGLGGLALPAAALGGHVLVETVERLDLHAVRAWYGEMV